MKNVSVTSHPLIFKDGVLGFEGYDDTGLFSIFSNGDHHFLLQGISEGSLLVVDTQKRFKQQGLNVFKTDVIVNGINQLKLSMSRIKGADYVGRVIMSINQYD